MSNFTRTVQGSEELTQMATIRDFMLLAAGRGEWLTLDEIAGTTEFGEASVSAQLRHLRKPRHGRYRVEKRRRLAGESEAGREIGLWEYLVLPPASAALPQPGAKPARGGLTTQTLREEPQAQSGHLFGGLQVQTASASRSNEATCGGEGACDAEARS